VSRLFALLLALAPALASAQSPELVAHMKACTMRVVVPNPTETDSPFYFGTGTIVGAHGSVFVVTNEHVARRRTKDIWVQFTPNVSYHADVKATSKQMDLAVMVARAQIGGGAITAQFDPDNKYYLGGFGTEGVFHVHPLKVRTERGTNPWIEFDGLICKGDSGGGVFNQHGKVVGVVHGGFPNLGVVYATIGAPFRSILSTASIRPPALRPCDAQAGAIK
jgi:S1-C subfamily serine protease